MSAPTPGATAGCSSCGGDGVFRRKPDGSDPLHCATCGELFIMADGKWRVCIDCPQKTITDIQPKAERGVVVSLNLTRLGRFVRAAFGL